MPKIYNKETPVYLHSAVYAYEHEEVSCYRASLQANIACKELIEKSVATHFSDNRLDVKSIMTELRAEFSMERIQYVLANTLRTKIWDGRFSSVNKAWSKSVHIANDNDVWGQSRNSVFVADRVHPAVLDGFITHFRKEIEKMPREKKSSVLEKLKEPVSSGRVSVSKAQER